MTANG